MSVCCESVCVCVCTHTGLGMFYAALLWGAVGGSFESAMMFHVEQVLGSNQNPRTVLNLNPIAFQEAVEFCLQEAGLLLSLVHLKEHFLVWGCEL